MPFVRYAGGNGRAFSSPSYNGDRLTEATFEEPYYIAYDPDRSILWVQDFQTADLRKVDGDTVTNVTDPVNDFSTQPFRVRASDGYLIVAGAIYDTTGAWVKNWANPPGVSFGILAGVDVASDGTIYASDRGNNAIWKSTDDGDTWTVVAGDNGYGDADGALGVGQFGEPKDLCLDEANGYLWVLDFYDALSRNIPRRVTITTGEIATVGTFDSSDEGASLTFHAGEGWWSNRGLYPDYDYRIESIAPDGTRSMRYRPEFEPAGLAFDAAGALYVANHSSPYNEVDVWQGVILGPPRIRGRNTAHPVRVRGRNAPAAVRVRGRRHSI